MLSVLGHHSRTWVHLSGSSPQRGWCHLVHLASREGTVCSHSGSNRRSTSPAVGHLHSLFHTCLSLGSLFLHRLFFSTQQSLPINVFVFSGFLDILDNLLSFWVSGSESVSSAFGPSLSQAAVKQVASRHDGAIPALCSLETLHSCSCGLLGSKGQTKTSRDPYRCLCLRRSVDMAMSQTGRVEEWTSVESLVR